MAASTAPKSSVLNSWKEIAHYLGRGVRTVQRWEHDLAMPVRRPRAKSRSAVVAIPEEIDAWLRTAPSHESIQPLRTVAMSESSVVRGAISEMRRLRQESQALRSEHHVCMMRLAETVRDIQVSVKADYEPPDQGLSGSRSSAKQ